VVLDAVVSYQLIVVVEFDAADWTLDCHKARLRSARFIDYRGG